MKDKVFVIGAGKGQVPIIEICRKRNYEVIVISREGDYPGFALADRYYHIDIKDKEKVLEAARKEKITAVLTDQLDAAVATTAYVAEQLSLPGIGYECAMKFTNKLLMKREVQKLGIEMPEYAIAHTVEEACSKADKIGYPVVIKPVDQEGSRGVIKVNCGQELEQSFNLSLKGSKYKYLEIEKFISGVEYIALGFAQDYEFTNLTIGQYNQFKLENYFIPKMRLVKDATSANTEAEVEILEKTKKIVQGFGMKYGISEAEFIYDRINNKVYFVEIAAIGGGMYVSSDVVPLACGINVTELLVDFATGRKIHADLNNLSTGVAGYLCFTLPEGTIMAVENVDKLFNIPGVHNAFLDTVQVGKVANKMVDKSMRLGPILFYGKTKNDCMETIKKVKDTLKISVNTPEGIKGIMW